jgi:class 3 adenylate cyclase
MNDTQKAQVSAAVKDGLDRAVSNWSKVGHLLKKVEASLEEHRDYVFDSVESLIPGYPVIADSAPEVDEFVALVVDMRNSTSRLKTILKLPEIGDGFQRVYYETSALLPAIAQTAAFEAGSVTEYLGDGALILFAVDKSDRGASIKAAYRAARDCVTTSRSIVNEQLRERFHLPDLNVGAGLSMSKALVALVGLPGNRHPKAIGECVWEASKLCYGTNTVHVSKDLHSAWPTGKSGTVRFTELRDGKCDGFRVVEN